MTDTSDTGQFGATNTTSETNGMTFLVSQMMGRISTATPVKVMAVYPAAVGDLTATLGTVDVLPLVNQQDGAGKITKHQTVYGISYSRIQGGKSAIIMDPKVGDRGWLISASRDISSVKANRDQANPGSRRRFSLSDGMFVGGLLNDKPTNYIQVDDVLGVVINTPKNLAVTVQGNASITVTGTNTVTAPTTAFVGNITATGEITAGFGGADQVTLQKHEHPTTPDGPMAPPVPGT